MGAGERVLIERVARATGTTVMLVDRGAGEEGEHRWETICVDHGGVCSHETRRLAADWLSHPDEWCEDCMYGPGTLAGETDESVRARGEYPAYRREA